MPPKLSIIIPAHNEAEVIERCLHCIIPHLNDAEVIVVCNACSDDTAERARALGDDVIVMETGIPSKVNAINMGEEVATAFPRFYIDADVQISGDAISAIAKVLTKKETLAAAPQVRLDLSGASWSVRAFYAIDKRLPSHREGIGGSGVYALSDEGRRRFVKFPDITADDAFVRRQFKPEERQTVSGAYSIVRPPANLKGLLAIKTRSHLGNYEIEKRFPELTQNRGASNRPVLVRLFCSPWFWPALMVYASVKFAARLRARDRLRRGDFRWERDDTSRLE